MKLIWPVLAILLENLNRRKEVVAAYGEALAQDPQTHDAHSNLSRLHDGIAAAWSALAMRTRCLAALTGSSPPRFATLRLIGYRRGQT